MTRTYLFEAADGRRVEIVTTESPVHAQKEARKRLGSATLPMLIGRPKKPTG